MLILSYRNSPLPFYALSNLITLFSHDMPTLQLIQHVFDYLLCRPPIVIVYLATAVRSIWREQESLCIYSSRQIILSRKDEVRRLEEEDEEGMMHSLLSGLPNITDESPSLEESIVKTEEDASSSVGTLDQEQPKSQSSASDKFPGVSVKEGPCGELTAILVETKIEDHGVIKSSDSSSVNDAVKSETQEETIPTTQIFPSDSKDGAATGTPSSPPSYHICESSRHALQKPSITLTSLLLQADHLYETYPPSHPSLALSSIMGPQSVMFTWSSSPSDLPGDDSAERMVDYPQLIVYPYVEEDNDQKEKRKGPRHRHLVKRRPRFRLRDRKTMITGAVLALGVAMAVYGVRSGIVYGEGRHTNFHFHRDWKRLGGWAGGFLIGAGNKILHIGDAS